MNKKFRVFLLLVLTIAFFNTNLSIAQDNRGKKKKTPFHISETSLPIKVDGVINEKAWENALKLELKYEVSPGENIAPPVKTEFLMTYNKSHLYAAFRCFDPDPSKIRAHLSDRDNDYGDDFVGVALDTFNDERKNFILWVNPRGVQEDAIMTSTNYGIDWDARYKSVGKITGWGYSIEMAIPFSSLRFQRTDGPQVWGIDAWRNYPRNVMHRMGLFPRDRSNNCYQCQMIKIQGFEGIKPGRNLEIIPTVIGVRTETRDDMPDGPLEKSTEKADLGVTARWGITPNLTLSGTLKPDFSQVEADARQLDINEPFLLFYREKRLFFTEGADYFSTGLNAVYTRTIREPSWGIKLTGKEGKNSLGAYIVRDDLTNLIFPGSQDSDSTSLEMDSTASVLRYKRDLGSKYTLGALFTNREGSDYFNRVLGVDGTFRFTGKDELNIQFLGSSTCYPDSVADEFEQKKGNFKDRAIYINFRHRTRNLNIFGGYQDMGADFRADLGFIPQVGYRKFFAAGDYRWLAKPGKWWSLFLVGGMFYQFEEQNGTPLLKGIENVCILDGTLHSTFYIITNKEREAYNGQEFDLFCARWHFHFRPTADLLFSIDGNMGDRIDYDNTRPGKRFRLTPNLRFSLGNHLRLDISHTYERMKADNKRLYIANISQGTIIYQFNTRTFIRSIFQYIDYNYNADNYIEKIEPEERHLFIQLLFSYKLNPQTVLFLGYTDNFLGNQDYRITRGDRTLFLKIGYAWQF